MTSLKNRYFKTLFFFFLSTFVIGQETGINSITENNLKTHLSYIASDNMKGRKLGDPELDSAAEYLIKTLKSFNLRSIEGKQGYKQSIDFIKVTPNTQNSWIKINNKITIPGDSVLSLFPHPENVIYNGSIVFAGYGVNDTTSGYNDYKDIDVNGKIVLMMSRTPKLAEKNNPQSQEPFNHHTEYEKIALAAKNGAKAILWVLDPMNKYNKLSDLSELREYAQAIYLKENPEIIFPLEFIIITGNTADLILKSSEKSLAYIQNLISNTKSPDSFEIPKTNFEIQINRAIKEFKSSNIIASIEGSDPVLKNEYIIYTAHYDHLGIDNKGNIYNGADDNGSGTVALLEIAKAFIQNPIKSKRTVVFAWMTAEEKGGIGSKYYVNHPIFPLEKTNACINIDMIGRVKEKESKNRRIDIKSKDSLFVITCHKSPELLKFNDEACAKAQLIPDYNDKFRLHYSDQVFFYEKGIPVLFYHTGFHQDMHSINDKIDKIDFPKMKRVTQVAFMVGFQFANNEKK